jgi:hypothetical protein
MVHVVGADFGERSCPKDMELRNENPQLAHHQTPPCNMYFVNAWLLFLYHAFNHRDEIINWLKIRFYVVFVKIK